MLLQGLRGEPLSATPEDRSCMDSMRISSAPGIENLHVSAQIKNQKPGDHPHFRKKALRVKRPFSELSESSGVFSEQLSEFEVPFSEYEIPFSEWHPTTRAIRTPQFSEQLPERFPELMGTHMKNYICPSILGAFFQELGWTLRATTKNPKHFSNSCGEKKIHCLCTPTEARL